MRILFVNFEYPPLGGGGGVMNALLAEELAKAHQVTVLTSRGLGLPGESVESGVRVLRAPVLFRKRKASASLPSMAAFLWSGIAAGRSLLGRESFDVINTHFVVPTGPVGHHLAGFAGIPNVLSLHGGDLYDPSKWTSPHRHAVLRTFIRSLLRKADAVVGQSSNTIDNMNRFYSPGVKAAIIPLGIRRPCAGDAASRRDLGFSGDEVLMVTVGRLVARKQVPQLLSLMARLSAERVGLVVIGGGEQEEALKAECKSRGLDRRVRFLGHIAEPEKFRVLRACDVFVSTSQHEGFGLVFLEAMAVGLPVVCYDHGGQTDFLEDGKTGCLIGLNDMTKLEEACRTLIRSRSLRDSLGRSNLQRVEEYFIESCAARYESLFDQLIHRRLPMAAGSSQVV